MQKEAYWNAVPCVTMRPSTEWLDTVEAGANVLVDDDPEAIVRAVAQARFPAEAPHLYGDGHAARADRGSSVRFPAVTEEAAKGTLPYDVAVIGAGYVGVPLAQTFADAGRRVLVVDVVPELVEALNHGYSHIEDVPSERLRPT